MNVGNKLNAIVLVICLAFTTALQAELSQAEVAEVGESFKSKVIHWNNHRDPAEIATYFDENAIIILGNAQIIRTRADIQAYMQAPYLEEEVRISKVLVDSFDIDSDVIVLGDNAFVLTGTATYRLTLAKTKEMKFSNRWVAVMHRTNETWKVASFQGTIDVFNNPIIDAITHVFYIISFVTFLLGIISLVIFRRFRRGRLR